MVQHGVHGNRQHFRRVLRALRLRLTHSEPRGFAPRTPLHALSLAAPPARSRLRQGYGGRAEAPPARRRAVREAHSQVGLRPTPRLGRSRGPLRPAPPPRRRAVRALAVSRRPPHPSPPALRTLILSRSSPSP